MDNRQRVMVGIERGEYVPMLGCTLAVAIVFGGIRRRILILLAAWRNVGRPFSVWKCLSDPSQRGVVASEVRDKEE